MAKKVLLFIVEGENDEFALALSLENLQKQHDSNKQIRFGITRGDITADKNRATPANEIAKCVREYCTKYKLNKEDICKIVLLVDMDGAYIPGDAVKQGGEELTKTYYGSTDILHKNPAALRKTHERKRERLDSLINQNEIAGKIPFNVFFVSCSFDHVICGDANVDGHTKIKITDEFNDLYHKNAEGLISFFCNPEIVIDNDYMQSWNKIRQGLNSLGRYSNMNVFFDMHYPSSVS